jgi:membrane protein YdbS with pleckstrin-like domain
MKFYENWNFLNVLKILKFWQCKILAKDAWFYYSLSFWGDHSTMSVMFFGIIKYLYLEIFWNFKIWGKFWTLKFLIYLF